MFNGAKVSIIPETEKGFSRKANRKNPIKVKSKKVKRRKKPATKRMRASLIENLTIRITRP